MIEKNSVSSDSKENFSWGQPNSEFLAKTGQELSPEQSPEWFETQFSNTETIDIGDGQQVEVLDITPPELKHETPILFIPGYGKGDPEERKANIFELAKQGRRVFAVKSPHGVNSTKAEEAPETLLRQVAAIIPVLENKQLDKVSMIGESRGGAIATLAAHLYPEKFENITLVDPVGMTKEMNTAKLIYRFLSGGTIEGLKMKLEDLKGNVTPMAKEQMLYGSKQFGKFVLSDVATSYAEVRDMAKAELFQKLKDIKSHGIGISIIHGVNDVVFPMDEIQQNISSEIAKFKQANPDAQIEPPDLDGVDKVIDGFYSVEGAHGGFVTKPEVYTRAAEQAITALEEKQKKHSQ